MEAMEFQPLVETFDSSMPGCSAVFGYDSDRGHLGYGETLFDLHSDGYDVFGMLEDECSSSDDEEIIDIEAIDELGGIMKSPDMLATFSSARTASKAASACGSPIPDPATNAEAEGTKEEARVEQPTVFKQPMVVEPPITKARRIRYDSEQVVEDVVELQATVGVSSAAPAAGSHLTHSLDDIMIDESMAADQLAREDFSLLGIDGIEAEDLESLFQKFEGAIEDSPVKAKTPSPVRPKVKPKRPITLDDYRKLRENNPASSSVSQQRRSPNYPASTPPLQGVKFIDVPPPKTRPVKKEPQMYNVKDVLAQNAPYKSVPPTANSGFEMPLALREPLRKERPQAVPAQPVLPKEFSVVIPVSEKSESSQKGLVQVKSAESAEERLRRVKHDHDYCKAEEAVQSHNVQTTNPVQSRDYKAEIEQLLHSLPKYIANIKNLPQSSQPSSQDNCSCEAQRKSSEISKESSSKPSNTEQDKPVGLPKAYTLPTRGRPKKRNYKKRRHSSSSSSSRSRSPSSSSSSSSSCSSSSDSSDSDSEHYNGRCGRDSSVDSCSSSDSYYTSKSRRKHKSYSRKSKRKSTRSNKKARLYSRSRSHRGRHKATSSSKRRRHKSHRSSQSVSPYSSTTSAGSRSPSVISTGSATRRRRDLEAHQLAMNERRVVYVGGIGDRYSRTDLRKRFGGFGEIESVTTGKRDDGENYGFVTFFSKADAYAAIEKGNDVYGPKFNLGFGGRRKFCNTEYADLDGCQAVKEEWAPSIRSSRGSDDDFDSLLKNSIRKIHN